MITDAEVDAVVGKLVDGNPSYPFPVEMAVVASMNLVPNGTENYEAELESVMPRIFDSIKTHTQETNRKSRMDL